MVGNCRDVLPTQTPLQLRVGDKSRLFVQLQQVIRQPLKTLGFCQLSHTKQGLSGLASM